MSTFEFFILLNNSKTLVLRTTWHSFFRSFTVVEKNRAVLLSDILLLRI